MKLKAELVTREHSTQGLRNDRAKTNQTHFFSLSLFSIVSHMLLVLNNIEIKRREKERERERRKLTPERMRRLRIFA